MTDANANSSKNVGLDFYGCYFLNSNVWMQSVVHEIWSFRLYKIKTPVSAKGNFLLGSMEHASKNLLLEHKVRYDTVPIRSVVHVSECK